MMGALNDDWVLVTGGAGFIGSHVVDRIMEEGAQVRVLDDMSNGKKENIENWMNNPKFEFIVGDIRNQDAVRDALKDISIVFHQAAKVSVPASVKNPLLTMDVNVIGTLILLDECRKQDITKVVVASSSSVYGDTPTLPKVESMSTNPISPYGVSKLTEEAMAVAFNRTYGLDTTAFRYFNVYGPRQRGGSYAGVISKFIKNALSGSPLMIDGDGSQTRDFTFIDDVVECNLLASNNHSSNGKVYNVGSGKRISINQLADIILEYTNSSSSKQYGPPRPGDVHDSLAGLDLVSHDLGYAPKTDIQEGIGKTIEWVKQQAM
jgi:UDP-glucose 4-epimerase